jgi:DNA polymerase III delta prime subunit
MSPPEVPRPDLEEALGRRARSGPPLLLAGPPGAGKTTLLLRLREVLAAEGWLPVYLDLMGAASSPDRFVLAALEVLPAEPLAARLPEATRIRMLAGAGRGRSGEAVRSLFALWSSLNDAAGKPVALLVDEATEIRSLAYFPELREVAKAFGQALAARRRGTVLATSFPTLARGFWPGLEVLEARPLTAADLVSAVGLDHGSATELVRLTFGWPRYVRALLERSHPSGRLEAWVEEMAPGGRLESACRHTHESLLLRSRGYGISKAALQAVAREEGLNLTALVARLGRTPGATRDYLQWLVGVDALRMVKKRYSYVDGLLRVWVRLYARGAPPTAAEIEDAGRALLRREPPTEPVTPEARAKVTLPEAATEPRRDTLIEID